MLTDLVLAIDSSTIHTSILVSVAKNNEASELSTRHLAWSAQAPRGYPGHLPTDRAIYRPQVCA